MIVFDLEWNSGLYDPIRLDEILQIGAVKLQAPGGPILDSFNVYIRPWIHKRFSPAAAALPDLALSKSSQLDFPAALEDFLDWCGEDRVFASWGNSDLTVLLQNQAYWKLKGDLPRTYVDLQLAFGRVLGASDNLSLEWCAEYCGVPDIFDPHNALADAVYTACIGQMLTAAELQDAVRAPGPTPKGQKALPRRSQPWQGPFDTLDKVLNNRGCRKGVCSKCGGATRMGQWFLGEDKYYYSKFTCPQCGRGYILRLEIYRDKRKKLWANTAVFRATGAKRDAFLAASQNQPVACKGKRRGGYRRRRKRSTSSSASNTTPAS